MFVMPTWIRYASLAIAGLAATPRPAPAADLRWSGELRVRAESFDRSLRSQAFERDVLQRVRLGAEATFAPELRVLVQIQDARVWGAEGTTLADLHNLDVHQSWAELSQAARGVQLSARCGRQELSYGDERIVGAVWFHNVGRAFDGVRLRGARGGWWSDAVAARVADRSQGGGTNDDVFLSYNRFAAATGSRAAEVYALHRATQAGARYETTLGARGDATWRALRFEPEIASQVGRRGLRDLRAWLVAGRAVWRAPRIATLEAGVDWLSGDDPADDTDQFLDAGRLFHTGHKFYGRLDVAETLADRAGLVDPHASIGLAGPGKLATRLDLHVLRVQYRDVPQVNGPLPPAGGSASLGTELDLALRLPWRQQTTFEALGTVLIPGARLENVGLDEPAYFGHLTLVVAF